MTAHEFEVPVSEIDAGGKAYRFPIRTAWLLGVLEESEATAVPPDGYLDVRLSKSGTDVVVHGKIEAHVEVPCARCLEPARVDVAQTVSVLMVPAAALKLPHGEHDLSPDEADVLTYSGDLVVLDDLVRDEILLEIPMIPLCSEDCPGMSAVLSKVAPEPVPAIDPRLAPLLELKKKTKE